VSDHKTNEQHDKRPGFAPDLPENFPRAGNRFTVLLGRTLLKLIGWRIEGHLPNEKKIIIALAPHTSNWDFVVAMFGILAMGVKVSFLMKKEAFVWPFRKLFLSLGGIPLDRRATENTVEQIKRWYDTRDKVCVAIAPEGTRAKVGKWKTGFLRIAHQANIPLLLIAWDYSKKALVIDKLWTVNADYDAEAEKIREYINGQFRGRHPHKQ